MIGLIVVEIFLLVLAILFSLLHKPKLACCAIGILILIPSGLVGGLIGGKIHSRVLPYVVFGEEKTRDNNIVLVGRDEEGYNLFSNGERARTPNSLTLSFYFGLGFLPGVAIVFCPGFFVAKRITRKYAPDVYKLLEPDSTQSKQL